MAGNGVYRLKSIFEMYEESLGFGKKKELGGVVLYLFLLKIGCSLIVIGL